ncbi:class I SAM-dependent methyltransferase [Pelagibacteraceae bacterium]|jgi:hypothetical protein|nr:class I SAM-dependent methyltransferase [Pelagibacteraceae bacterium]
MIIFLKKKIQRLLVSKNVKKLFYIYHYISGGFKSRKIDVSFINKKNRIEIVQNIINQKKYISYLEIGTFKDELFAEVKCNKKIGVDPVSGGNIRKTSDNFFLENKEKFDLIFIDGLHHYGQVKKDITNSLDCLNDGGIILMHDCMPRDYYYQAVPRCQYEWNGDTWKAFLEFRSKQNVDSYCCYADQGIGVILKRKNTNKLELDIKNYKKFSFNDYAKNYQKYLNLIEYNDLMKIIQNYE